MELQLADNVLDVHCWGGKKEDGKERSWERRKEGKKKKEKEIKRNGQFEIFIHFHLRTHLRNTPRHPPASQQGVPVVQVQSNYGTHQTEPGHQVSRGITELWLFFRLGLGVLSWVLTAADNVHELRGATGMEEQEGHRESWVVLCTGLKNGA